MRKCEDYVFFLNLFQLGAAAVPNKAVGINWFMRWCYLLCWAVYGLRKYKKVK